MFRGQLLRKNDLKFNGLRKSDRLFCFHLNDNFPSLLNLFLAGAGVHLEGC